jgi:hypothetical protein
MTHAKVYPRLFPENSSKIGITIPFIVLDRTGLRMTTV